MTMAPTKAICLLKGFSTKIVFALIPNIRKRYPKGNLWNPRKFVTTIDHITLDKAKEYLENHHAKKHMESLLWSEAEESTEGRGFSPREDVDSYF